MSISLKKPAFVIVFWMVGVLAAWGVANTTDSQPLGKQGMNDVRGSAPGPCNGNWTYSPCTEGLTSCWAADGNQPGCDPLKACDGCNQAALNQNCSSAKPWNALCDPKNNGNDPTGCGFFFQTGAKCSWNGNTQQCRCSGNPDTKNCGRYTAVRTDDPNDPNKSCTAVK
jgi:hypothetical protein